MTDTQKLILECARLLYSYLQLTQCIDNPDALIVLGCDDLSVAEFGASLTQTRCVDCIVFSGNAGRNTEGCYSESEASTFYKHSRGLISSNTRVFLEERATNTGENIKFSMQLLQSQGIETRRILLVAKPSMSRRALLTFQALYSSQVGVCSPPIEFDSYLVEDRLRPLIHSMVGNLDRILKYPSLGFQKPDKVPLEIINAHKILIGFGFSQQLLPLKDVM